MSSLPKYLADQPERADVDARRGALVLNFGTNWCGFCRASWPPVEQAFRENGAGVEHVMVEDGSGRKLGRSFGVRLWPTLIFFRDGVEVARLVRPADVEPVAQALAQLQG